MLSWGSYLFIVWVRVCVVFGVLVVVVGCFRC